MELLRRSRELGDFLYVGLSTDFFNKEKDKASHFNYEQRERMLNGVKYVDHVFEENNWDQKIDDILKYKIDVLVMGSDWTGKFDYLEEYCKVIYLPRTIGISSSKIKGLLKEDSDE